MEPMRKALAALFTVLGAYYCALGVLTLVRLPGVTRRWIELSGDPDFKYDYGTFVMLSGVGATLIAVLGWRTFVKGMATARGRSTSWLGPALATVPLHSFWLLYRIIGSGTLDRQSQVATLRTSAIQFGIVCVGYFLLWVMSHRPNRQEPADIALHPAAAG
jgi:hypothetical protein